MKIKDLFPELAFIDVEKINCKGKRYLDRVYKKEYIRRRVNGESAAEILGTQNTVNQQHATGLEDSAQITR